MNTADILIQHASAYIDGRIVEDVSIWIKDGMISMVLTPEDYEIASLVSKISGNALPEAKQVIHAKGKLALPGLVNTHTHIAMGLLRNYADDLPLMDWLETAIFPAEAKLTEDAIYWGTQLGIAEMLRSGTTCFNDMYFFMDTTAQVVAETGIRAVLSRGLAGVSPSAQEALQENKELYTTWHGYDNHRIKVMLGPHAIYTCPEAYLVQVKALAEELGAEIHMHMSETLFEVETSFKEHGKSPVAYVADLGLMEHGFVAAHCVHVSEEDMTILKEKEVRVAHNPQSNLKLASGIAPLEKILAKGILVGLGTDGSASNNNADMLEEVRLAALLHKGTTLQAKEIPAPTALSLGTEMGAKVLGYPTLGRIETGYMADIVLYDMSGMHWLPKNNVLSSFVYAANSSDADTVIVAGKVLMEKKELLTIDEERLRHEVMRVHTKLLS